MKLPDFIRDSTQMETFAAGDTIFKVGDEGKNMYVVDEGEVDIVFDGQIIETVAAEGFFGELALIDDGHRSTGAVARTDCKLILLNAHRFSFLVDEVPFFALNVMKVMAKRLRRASGTN